MARSAGEVRAEVLDLLKRAANFRQYVEALATLAKKAVQGEVAKQRQRDDDEFRARHSQTKFYLEAQLRGVIVDRFRLLTNAVTEHLQTARCECEEITRRETEALEREFLAARAALAQSKLGDAGADDLDVAYGRQLAEIDQQYQRTVVELERTKLRAVKDAQLLKELAETAAIREIESAREKLQKYQADRLSEARAKFQQEMSKIEVGRAELVFRVNALQVTLRNASERLDKLRHRLLVCAPSTEGLSEEVQHLATRLLTAQQAQLRRLTGELSAARAELLSRPNPPQTTLRKANDVLDNLRHRLLACAPRTAPISKLVQQYTARLQTARPDLPQHLRNWADADWQPFTPPTTPPRSSALRVAYKTVHIANQPVEIPLLVNFFERSQLWLHFPGGSKEWNNLFLGSLVLRLFATLPPTYLRLIVFDPLHLGTEPEIRVFANHFKEPEFRVIVTASDLERQCDELIASAPGIAARLPYHYDTVFAMNRDAALKEKHTVVLLRSLPKPNDTGALDKLKVIVETGHVSGFHVLGVLPPLTPPMPPPAPRPGVPVLHAMQSAPPPMSPPIAGNRPLPARPGQPAPPRIAPVPGNRLLHPGPPLPSAAHYQPDLPFIPDPIIDVRRDAIRVLRNGHPVLQGTPDTLYAPAFVAQTLSAIRQNIENPRHIPRQFKDFIARGTTRFAASSIDGTEVPLAYDHEYKRLINIRFDSEHFTHALIVGMSGQGKSSVLHRIVAGLASRYSPDEVQFVLIDDKDGVEFDRYRRLPHVRLLSLRGSYLNTLATLEYLGKEMDSRYLTMRGHADSIARYRKKSDTRMPRLFLVWDEAYEAFTEKNPVQDRVIDAIRRLAEKGRAAGIHLVLATNHGEVYQIRRVTDMMPIRINLPHKHTDVFADLHRGGQTTVPKRKGQAQFVGFDDQELERPQLANLLEPALEHTDEWWTSVANEIADEAIKAGYEYKPRIFDGTALIDPAQHATQIARRISISDQRTPLFLGESISRIAEQPVSLNLSTDTNECMLYLGGRDVFPLLMARQGEFLEVQNGLPCKYILCATPSERLRALLNVLRPMMSLQSGPFDPYQTLASLEHAIASGERQTIFVWGLDGIAHLPETAELISQAPSQGANIVAWSRAETLEQLSSLSMCLDSFAYKAVMTTDRHMFSQFTDTPLIDPGPQCATLIDARRTTLAFAPYMPDQPLLRGDKPAASNVKPISG